MKENKQKERDEDCEEMTDRKGTQQQQQRLRSLLSTTVVASRRTLHSKVSTQRACCERERMVEVPPPSASWSPPTIPASLPADSCTPVIYFSPPHLAGRLLPITQSRGSTLTARHPARAMASWCDTLCCWTLPTGDPLKSVCHFNFHYCCSFGRFPSQSSG